MPNSGGSMRAFIAIELPVAIRSELTKLQKNLQKQCNCPAKWVDAANMHLTLAFLGEVPPPMLANARQAILQAIIGLAPFELTLDKLGAFPNLEHPHIIWIGFSNESHSLISLQTKLGQLLRHKKFTLEERAFCPHLTLSRIRDEASHAEKRSLGQLLNSAELTSQASFSVQTISLIQSRLTPYGPIYSTLFRAELHPKTPLSYLCDIT
jgi:2'-5' RNA ligase